MGISLRKGASYTPPPSNNILVEEDFLVQDERFSDNAYYSTMIGYRAELYKPRKKHSTGATHSAPDLSQHHSMPPDIHAVNNNYGQNYPEQKPRHHRPHVVRPYSHIESRDQEVQNSKLNNKQGSVKSLNANKLFGCVGVENDRSDHLKNKRNEELSDGGFNGNYPLRNSNLYPEQKKKKDVPYSGQQYQQQQTSYPALMPQYQQQTSHPVQKPQHHQQNLHQVHNPQYHQQTSHPAHNMQYHQPTSHPAHNPQYQQYHQQTSHPALNPQYHQQTSHPAHKPIINPVQRQDVNLNSDTSKEKEKNTNGVTILRHKNNADSQNTENQRVSQIDQRVIMDSSTAKVKRWLLGNGAQGNVYTEANKEVKSGHFDSNVGVAGDVRHVQGYIGTNGQEDQDRTRSYRYVPEMEPQFKRHSRKKLKYNNGENKDVERSKSFSHPQPIDGETAKKKKRSWHSFALPKSEVFKVLRKKREKGEINEKEKDLKKRHTIAVENPAPIPTQETETFIDNKSEQKDLETLWIERRASMPSNSQSTPALLQTNGIDKENWRSGPQGQKGHNTEKQVQMPVYHFDTSSSSGGFRSQQKTSRNEQGVGKHEKKESDFNGQKSSLDVFNKKDIDTSKSDEVQTKDLIELSSDIKDCLPEPLMSSSFESPIAAEGIACGSYNLRKAEMNYESHTWPRRKNTKHVSNDKTDDSAELSERETQSLHNHGYKTEKHGNGQPFESNNSSTCVNELDDIVEKRQETNEASSWPPLDRRYSIEVSKPQNLKSFGQHKVIIPEDKVDYVKNDEFENLPSLLLIDPNFGYFQNCDIKSPEVDSSMTAITGTPFKRELSSVTESPMPFARSDNEETMIANKVYKYPYPRTPPPPPPRKLFGSLGPKSDTSDEQNSSPFSLKLSPIEANDGKESASWRSVRTDIPITSSPRDESSKFDWETLDAKIKAIEDPTCVETREQNHYDKQEGGDKMSEIPFNGNVKNYKEIVGKNQAGLEDVNEIESGAFNPQPFGFEVKEEKEIGNNGTFEEVSPEDADRMSEDCNVDLQTSSPIDIIEIDCKHEKNEIDIEKKNSPLNESDLELEASVNNELQNCEKDMKTELKIQAEVLEISRDEDKIEITENISEDTQHLTLLETNPDEKDMLDTDEYSVEEKHPHIDKLQGKSENLPDEKQDLIVNAGAAIDDDDGGVGVIPIEKTDDESIKKCLEIDIEHQESSLPATFSPVGAKHFSGFPGLDEIDFIDDSEVESEAENDAQSGGDKALRSTDVAPGRNKFIATIDEWSMSEENCTPTESGSSSESEDDKSTTDTDTDSATSQDDGADSDSTMDASVSDEKGGLMFTNLAVIHEVSSHADSSGTLDMSSENEDVLETEVVKENEVQIDDENFDYNPRTSDNYTKEDQPEIAFEHLEKLQIGILVEHDKSDVKQREQTEKGLISEYNSPPLVGVIDQSHSITAPGKTDNRGNGRCVKEEEVLTSQGDHKSIDVIDLKPNEKSPSLSSVKTSPYQDTDLEKDEKIAVDNTPFGVPTTQEVMQIKEAVKQEKEIFVNDVTENRIHMEDRSTVHQSIIQDVKDDKPSKASYTKLSQAKAILLGNVAAGKTSFLNAMRYQSAKLALPGADGRTIGIEVHSVNLQEDLKLWFYDFGGHETYKFSQQLFLSKQAIYIIVVDIAAYTPEKFSKCVEYWYDVLTSCLVAPVICVLATHIDLCEDNQIGPRCLDIQKKIESLEQSQVELLQTQLKLMEDTVEKAERGELDNLHDFHVNSLIKPLEKIKMLLENRPRISYEVNRISSKTLEGLSDMSKHLISLVQTNRDCFPEANLPKSWLKFADEVVSRREDLPYLTREQFENLAKDLGIPRKQMNHLLYYMQSVGVVLHYEDFRKRSDLTKYVFNNANLLLAIFGLIFNHNYYMDEIGYIWKNRSLLEIPRHDFERLRTNVKEEGILGEKLLRCFWKSLGIEEDVFKVILSLLEKFDLCFEVVRKNENRTQLPSGRHFCFPYLLKENPPTKVPVVWYHRVPEGFNEYRLRLYFTGSSLPHGFMERISVRLNPYLDHRIDWKHGIIAFCNDGQDMLRIDSVRNEYNTNQATLVVTSRVRSQRTSMARHILLIVVGIINRVLSKQYPGVVGFWYVICGHCILLAQSRVETRLDKFPADNIVFKPPNSSEVIRCKNCADGEILEPSTVFPVKETDSQMKKMSSYYVLALKEMKDKILQEIDARDLLQVLLKKGTLDINLSERIAACSPKMLRNEMLLGHILHQDDKGFLCFVTALQNSEYQRLAESLETCAETNKLNERRDSKSSVISHCLLGDVECWSHVSGESLSSGTSTGSRSTRVSCSSTASSSDQNKMEGSFHGDVKRTKSLELPYVNRTESDTNKHMNVYDSRIISNPSSLTFDDRFSMNLEENTKMTPNEQYSPIIDNNVSTQSLDVLSEGTDSGMVDTFKYGQDDERSLQCESLGDFEDSQSCAPREESYQEPFRRRDPQAVWETPTKGYGVQKAMPSEPLPNMGSTEDCPPSRQYQRWSQKQVLDKAAMTGGSNIATTYCFTGVPKEGVHQESEV